MAKVSYIMTTMNSRQRDNDLAHTIHSLKSQTLTDWELLLYNNNKKRPLDLIEDDDRIFIWNNADNSPTNNIVKALDIMTSNVVLLQADDDVNFPERAQLCYESIERGNDVFFASALLCDKDYEVFYYYQQLPFNENFHFTTSISNSICFGAFNKETMPKLRPEMPFLADWALVADAYLAGLKFEYTPTPLGKRIQNNDGVEGLRKTGILEKEFELCRKYYDRKDLFMNRNSKKVLFRMPKPVKI